MDSLHYVGVTEEKVEKDRNTKQRLKDLSYFLQGSPLLAYKNNKLVVAEFHGNTSSLVIKKAAAEMEASQPETKDEYQKDESPHQESLPRSKDHVANNKLLLEEKTAPQPVNKKKRTRKGKSKGKKSSFMKFTAFDEPMASEVP